MIGPQPEADGHLVTTERLGEYASIQHRHGIAAADRAFPDVRDHMAGQCRRCRSDLRLILEMLEADD
jgi:hypothetical protein